MKDERYTSIICKKFCNYYKPKEEFQFCEGYAFLKRNLTHSELRDLIKIFNISENSISHIRDLSFCNPCDFRIDGCDFFLNQSDTPCGGFLIINRILQNTNPFLS